MYIVDENLAVYSPKYLLADARTRELLKQDTGIQAETDPPIAVSSDGKLIPGQIYPSSNEETVRYYLPQYQLRKENDRFTTSLKWRGLQDDPNGPLAWLSIELTPTKPNFSDPTELRFDPLREIPHQAVVRIAYELPVQGEAQTAAPQWEGTWINVDPNTSGMTRLIISKAGENLWTFHGFGKCHPTDCDWNITSASFNGVGLGGVYDFGWKKTWIRTQLSGNQLIVETLDDYTEQDGRQDRNARFTMMLEQGKPSLHLEVGALETISAEVRRCRLAIHSKEEFDLLFRIMTDPLSHTRLEIECFAQIGHRTWKQIVSDRIGLTEQAKAFSEKQVLVTEMVETSKLEYVNPDPKRSWVKTRMIESSQDQIRREELSRDLDHAVVKPRFVDSLEQSPLINRIDPVILQGNLDQFVLRPTPRMDIGKVRMARFNAEVQNIRFADVDKIVLNSQAVRVLARPLPEVLQETDIKLETQEAAVPVRAVLDQKRRPALLRVPVRATQELSFFFVKEMNAYMFSAPADWTPSTNQILLKRTLPLNGKTYKFYQHSAIREQFYFEPEEFRLSYSSEAPFLPDLRVALFDLASGNDPKAPNLHYRAVMTYKALPYLNPQVLEQAKIEFTENGKKPLLTSLEPQVSQLFLDLPLDAKNGDRQSTEQTVHQLTFDDGIVDEIDLSATELKQIRLDLSSGLGLTGLVKAKLFDNSEANVRVNLSVGMEKQQDEEFWSKIVIYQGLQTDTFKVMVKADPSYFATTPAGMQPLTALRVEFESSNFVTLTPDAPAVQATLKIPPIAWLLDKPDAKKYRYRVVNLHGETIGQASEMRSGEGESDLLIEPAM